MLLTKTVMVKWHGNNKKWYEEKGYVYTKKDDEFEVPVSDLNNKSGSFVHVKCDCKDCENPYLKPMTYCSYKKSVKENGKYYCKKCSYNLYSAENTRKTKLINSKSFEQWCIENNRQDILDRWDYKMNIYNPNEISYSTHIKIYFKCLIHAEHCSELKSIKDFTKGYNGVMDCKQCNSFAQWGIDNLEEGFLEKYWDYNKNTVDPWNIDKCSQKKVWINCQEKDYHGSYSICCSNFKVGGRCSYCTNNQGKVHPLDSLGQYVVDNYGEEFLNKVWSEKNKKSAFDYSPKSKQKMYWKCPDGKHEDYLRSIKLSNNCDFRCPECVREKDESFLQEKVRIYLEDLGYEILHEYKCNIMAQSPRSKKGHMPYDNEVVELNLIIEVHGRQHYEMQTTGSKWLKEQENPEEHLHKRQLYDRYKRIYAKSQGYNYLEIPYWTDDKDKTWKKLIDDKLKEIYSKL